MELPFAREALKNLFSKTSCDMYPVKESVAAVGYRGRIFFDAEKCIDCGMCERVCAGVAIHTVKEEQEDGILVSRTFDLGSCTFCSMCADFCSRKAIVFTQDYHMVATKEEDLLVKGSFLKKKPVKKAPPAAAPAAAAKPAAPAAEAPAAAPAAEVKPRDDGKPVNDPSKCVYCTICARKCPAEALTVDRAAKTWVLDEEKCIGCGTCAEACPKKCILL